MSAPWLYCSLREKTRAHRRLVDDVPLEVKNARMRSALDVYREIAAELNAEFVGTKQLALVEGVRKILDSVRPKIEFG